MDEDRKYNNNNNNHDRNIGNKSNNDNNNDIYCNKTFLFVYLFFITHSQFYSLCLSL